jgi:hypothetical protein
VGRSAEFSIWRSSAGHCWTELQSRHCRAKFHSGCRDSTCWDRDASGQHRDSACWHAYAANWNRYTSSRNSNSAGNGYNAGDNSAKSEHTRARCDYTGYKSKRYESSRYNYTWNNFAKFGDAKQPTGRNPANYSASDRRYDVTSMNW